MTDAAIAKLDEAIKELKQDTQRVWSRHQMWTRIKSDEEKRRDELVKKLMEMQAHRAQMDEEKRREELARMEIDAFNVDMDEMNRRDELSREMREMEAYRAEVDEEVAQVRNLLVDQSAAIGAELAVVDHWIKVLNSLPY